MNDLSLMGLNIKYTHLGIDEKDVPPGIKLFKGKVRDVIDIGKELIFFTSDRISAFDVVLSAIPFKGEILNRIALFWFKKTDEIIKNHIVEEISARTVKVKKCEILPVEVIVRGYLTGSAWRDYSSGKDISGIKLPKGMKFNRKFEKPLLTPSTKAGKGKHDEPISCEEIVSAGLVDKKIWQQVEEAAFALFERGSNIAAKNNLILVDTKYEFGILDGKLIIADEIHTPDSSRFWYADSYEKLYNENSEQRQLDKEYFRQWLISKGYMGSGTPPEIPEDVRVETVKKYIDLFEKITGKKFLPESLSPEAEKEKIRSIIK
jgi:phosphoribosylaminoimidazole-succinocarboxamide synthase